MRVALDVAAQLRVRFAGIELRVVLALPDQPVVAVHRRVGLEHVEDEAFLDRLLHRVAMEGPMPDAPFRVGRQRLAEHLQRLVLRRRGEGEVAGVGQHPARRHALFERRVHRVLGVRSRVVVVPRRAERLAHRRRGLAALTRMRLVDDDGKGPAALGGDLVKDEGKFLHRRDDDLPALFDEPAQVARALGVPDRRADLHELPDRRLDLVVEQAPVGDHDHRVENLPVRPLRLIAVALQTDELVRQPGDRIRLAAARRVLDQVAPARPMGAHVGQRLAHDAELVIARPDLPPLLPARARVPLLDDLRVVLDDVRQTRGGEHLLPEVVGLQAVRVGRVAGAVVVALVERQEPRASAAQLGAHSYLALVDREVHRTAAELEQPFARIAVAPVLLDGILDRLFGEAVLQLESGDRQAVDEQAQVESAVHLVAAVGELARDREAVLRVPYLGPGVAFRCRAVEQVEVQRPVRHALAQHVDDAAFADLGRKAGEELEAVDVAGAVRFGQRQLPEGFGLGGAQEGEELRHVERVGAVVVSRAAGDVASAAVGRAHLGSRVRGHGRAIHADHVAHDQRFESLFGDVGSRHAQTCSSTGGVHPVFASTPAAMPIWRRVNRRLRGFHA